MGLRAVIVENDPENRAMLEKVISDLGHELELADGPEFCEAYQLQRGYCPLLEPCCDIQIVNQHAIPRISGVKFVDWQRRCGCKLHESSSAVISEGWSAKEVRLAARLGIKTLTKPFLVKELVDWIYQVKHSRRISATL